MERVIKRINGRLDIIEKRLDEREVAVSLPSEQEKIHGMLLRDLERRITRIEKMIS